MREVAVTGGDRVEAQIQLGWSVNGYGVGDLVGRIADVADAEVDRLVEEYEATYALAPALAQGRREARRACATPPARRSACAPSSRDGGFGAFTTTFEDLHGLQAASRPRLPAAHGRGLRLRGRGRLEDRRPGPADEGDVGGPAGRRVLHGGLHLPPGQGEGAGPRRAHARGLPFDRRPGSPRSRSTRSASAARPIPAAWCSTPAPGPAVAATLVDMGGRMRMIVNEVDVVKARPSRCPSCRWPAPSGSRAPTSGAAARPGSWRAARTTRAFSRAVTADELEDFAAMAGRRARPHRARDRTSRALEERAPLERRRLRIALAAWRGGARMPSPYRELKERGLEANLEIPQARPRHLHLRQRLGLRRRSAASSPSSRAASPTRSSRADDMVVRRPRGQGRGGQAPPLVRHPHPRRPLPRLPGPRRRRPHPLHLRDGLGAGAPAHPHLRDDPRRPPGRGRALHGSR